MYNTYIEIVSLHVVNIMSNIGARRGQNYESYLVRSISRGCTKIRAAPPAAPPLARVPTKNRKNYT